MSYLLNKMEAGNIDWEIDVVESSGDESIIETCEKDAPILKPKIPRYDEARKSNSESDLCYRQTMNEAKAKTSAVNELLKKSVIGPGFEQLKSIPNSFVSRRALKKERQRERSKTKGSNWFNIPAQEVTEEVKNDLDLLRMRSVLDPRHHYKKNDITHVPKFFQVGTVVEGPAEFYNGRIKKSDRKKSLVAELMADVNARAAQKKNYQRILAQINRKKQGQRLHSGGGLKQTNKAKQSKKR